MITFTKEQLIASAHARIEFAEMMLAGELEPLKERTWSIELELARIALASLEAVPVGTFKKGPCGYHPSFHEDAVPLYTAPPAPISVPAAMEMDDDFDSSFEHGKAVGWNAYRAAMLQGADRPQNEPQNIPENITTLREAVDIIRSSGISVEAEKIQSERDSLNSPVIPDGWIPVSERMPGEKTGVLVACEMDGPGDWRMKWATLVPEHPDAINGWLIPGASWTPTHWMPLPAAPHFREISNSSTNNCRENAKTSTNQASLNSNVTIDCWCHTCRPVTMSDMRFVVCPDCGNKRCPHANDHRNACTGSNEPGQIGSAYPAAPQQEVK